MSRSTAAVSSTPVNILHNKGTSMTRTALKQVVAASIVFAASCLFAWEASAGMIVVNSDDADGAVFGTGDFPGQNLIVGDAANTEYSGIAFFELPDLTGQNLVGATLKFTVQQAGSISNANGDIWGLGFVVPSPALVPAWRLVADTDAAAGLGIATRTKIADDIVPMGVALSVDDIVETSALSFIQSLYDGGAVAGDFAVVRFNADAGSIPTSEQYRFGGSHTSQISTLTLLIAAPEPSTFVLLGMGVAGLVLRRTRRRRA